MSNDDVTTEEEFPPTHPFLSNKVYDLLKSLVLIWLPAFSTFYFTLGSIWGFPGIEKVIGTTAALATMIGVVLRGSAKSYKKSDIRYDGSLVLMEAPEGGSLYSLELNGDPADLANKSEIVFKVQS